MKKTTLITVGLFFFVQIILSQSTHKRIIVPSDSQSTINLLLEQGIDLKCGAIFKNNSIQLELSGFELEKLNESGINYTVEIEDLIKYYDERITQNIELARSQLTIEKSLTPSISQISDINLDGTIASAASITSTTTDNFLQYAECDEVDWAVPANFNLNPNPAPNSFGGCLTVSQVEAELDQMRALYPNLISVKMDASPTGELTRGNTLGSATFPGQTVYYVRISDNPDTDEANEPEVLYTSMIHAREVSSLMSNLFYMWYLLENYNSDPAIKNLVDNNEMYFVPVVNPDGLRWNEIITPNGGGLQRKNLRVNSGDSGSTSSNNTNRGVDLNRNFDYLFGSAGDSNGSSGTPSSDSYRGPSAFSEPESRILRDFVLSRNFETALMHHSSANSIPHPYGGIPSRVSGREDEMHKWHEDMTRFNRYVSGATIFTPANGIADDWMLGGTTDGNGSVGSGRNILASTPEHGLGSEGGFWPNPVNIVPIAKRAMRINLMNAYYAGQYAKLNDLTKTNISNLTSNLEFGIERIGQTNSDFTLTVTPVSLNITSITSPSVQTGMTILEQRNITAQLQLNAGIQPNEKIEYNVKLSNGNGVVFYDANFEKIYQPNIIFSDNPDTDGLSNWTVSGGNWVTSTTNPFSGTTAIKSGSTVPYANNANSTLTSAGTFDFSSSSEVIIQFYSRWDLERNFDFVEIEGSTNGTTWQPLCGVYNKPEAPASNNDHADKASTNESFQQNNSSGRVYDGDQMNKWVMEEIVVDATHNSFLLNATNAQIRFRFRTDSNNRPENYSTDYSGFFIDDFTITGVSVPCVTSVPTNVVASGITQTEATINWNSIPSATYDLRYRVVGTSTWTDILDLATANSNLTGLTASTDYEVQVRSKCGSGNNSAYSSSTAFTTLDEAPITYCDSASGNASEEFISRVQLNTIDNSSTGQVYTDFTNISTVLTKEEQYTITITPTWTGTVYNEAYSVWIDYNRNGDFTDPGEQVLTSAPSQSTSISGNFVVPVGAVENSTRMRVSMKYNAAPTPCETFQFGEVEDYTIVIQGSGPDIEAPSAPTNLVANNTAQTTTDLSWSASTDNVGVTGYDVLQDGTVIATVTGLTYQVTGLIESTDYQFSIVAKDAADNVSVASNVVNVTTLDPPDTESPSAPTNLVANNTTQTTTDLSWTASTDNVGVTDYDILQDGTNIATVTGLTHQVTGLTASTSYNFSIVAKDAAGNVSIASNIVNIVTPDTESPTAPTNLIANNITQTSTDLNWTASTDNVGVTEYDVSQDGIIIANVTGTTYQVTGLIESTSYSFSITAKDAAGNVSPASNVENITTLDPPDTESPSAPESLVSSNTTFNSTDLSWGASTDNVGVTGYDVLQDGVVIATVANTTYQVTGLSGDTSYAFIVRAEDAAGNESANSNTVNVTTLTPPDTQSPSAPTNLTASGTTLTTTDLSWGASTDNVGVTGYDVLRDGIVIATVTGTNYQAVGLTESTSYAFVVRAEDAAGNQSGNSNTVNVTTLTPPDTQAPSAPTNLTASNTTQTSTDLSWTQSTDNVGVTSYDVSQDGIVVATVTGTNYQVTGLTASTSYAFTVRAEDAAGNQSGNSNTVNVTTLDIPTNTGCSNGINSFPYSEGFESGLGTWTQSTADDNNWTVNSGGTPSQGTGPSSAIEGSSYVFVEASVNGTGFPNIRSILNSPCFDLSNLTEATFTFQNHMFGSNDFGSIDLEISDDDGATWTSIWSRTGNQGNQWNTANVDLTSYVGGSVQLRFNRVTGGIWQADFALDNISLTEGAPEPPTGCSGGITSFPYEESFENNLGAWTQSTADDINWTVDANGTPSNGTGPSSAIDGNSYVYVEASGQGTGFPNMRAILNSPCFDLSNETSATFDFNYHMFGSNDFGSIVLEASNDSGLTWTSLWSLTGNQGNQWNTANIDLTLYVGGSVQLRFNRVTGGTWQADFALDNVELNTSSVAQQVENPILSNQNSLSSINDIVLYPNPVQGNTLNVSSNFDDLSYEVYNIIGQVVSKGKVINKVINVSELTSAVYHIRFTTGEETITKRFIKR
ncbi:T9SS C-terminal target domain-containing protein [Flavobacteriaceae bacterium AU392]|nr:T9SS C-terminal target domain-containing protein [Flavobacteriaceae bacterium]RKM84926.1 T9SS C-terminal target domain-containing protein [Flavobacteriaceae bacterium AU392]